MGVILCFIPTYGSYKLLNYTPQKRQQPVTESPGSCFQGRKAKVAEPAKQLARFSGGG
jgi:hypothetical protein